LQETTAYIPMLFFTSLIRFGFTVKKTSLLHTSILLFIGSAFWGCANERKKVNNFIASRTGHPRDFIFEFKLIS
tara:strand:- start:8702 stop:8923 length:222 start_codon:yes stop_codon:yes gene_type:complete